MMEALLMDTLISKQLCLQPPSLNPIFLNSHTSSVFLNSCKRPDPAFMSRGCPLTKGSTVFQERVIYYFVQLTVFNHMLKSNSSFTPTYSNTWMNTLSCFWWVLTMWVQSRCSRFANPCVDEPRFLWAKTP